jgi:hypothetical protein
VALPFAALGDLLEERADDLLPGLPDPQRTALEIALLRRAPQDAPVDRLASSRARRAMCLRV